MDRADESYDQDLTETSFAYQGHHTNASPVAQEEDWEGYEEEYDEGETRLEGDEQEEEGEDDHVNEEDEEDYDASSDTSSVIFDPKTDPEGFARRLDELAGVLEVSEQEAQALKWGAPIKRQADGM
jgi:hypothetical protein